MSGLAKLRMLQKQFDHVPVNKIMKEVLTPMLPEIERLNKVQLEKYGIDANGQALEPAYAPFTVRKKRAEGKEADHVTLKDTGRFHGTIRAKVMASSVRIASASQKYPLLAEKYGEDILGLAPFNLAHIRQQIKPNVRKLFLIYFLGD